MLTISSAACASSSCRGHFSLLRFEHAFHPKPLRIHSISTPLRLTKLNTHITRETPSDEAGQSKYAAFKLASIPFLAIVLLSDNPDVSLAYILASITSYFTRPTWSRNRYRSESAVDCMFDQMLNYIALLAVSVKGGFHVALASSIIGAQETGMPLLRGAAATNGNSKMKPATKSQRIVLASQTLAIVMLLTQSRLLLNLGLPLLWVSALFRLTLNAPALVSSWSTLVNPPKHIRKGLQKFYRKKARTRENRINQLLSQIPSNRSKESDKMLQGLLVRGDTYNPSIFSDSHRSFKASQNSILADLSLLCSHSAVSAKVNQTPNIFYLEGTDGGTSSALRDAGFAVDQFYVANMFSDTVAALKQRHGLVHAVISDAQRALRHPPFSNVPFLAYYFDGCGGETAPIVSMIEAIFHPERPQPFPQIAVGFTLTAADKSGESLFDREANVVRALNAVAQKHNYLIQHVSDDPGRYLRSNKPILKSEGKTLCTWMVLEKLGSEI